MKRTNNKPASILLMAIAYLALSACGSDAQKFIEAVTVNNLGITAIVVSSPNSIVEVGGTETFTATAQIGTGSSTLDITDQVRWTRSDASVASISQSGVVTAVANGTISVKAELADLSASKDLTISDANLLSIDIVNSPAAVGVCSGGHQLSASGNYDDAFGARDITSIVAWASDNELIATVDSSGMVSTFSDGNVNFTATRNSITSADWLVDVQDTLASIVLSPASASLTIGSTLQLAATGTYVDASTADITATVDWSAVNTDASTTTAYLSVSNVSPTKGLATALAAGNSTISAVCNSTTPATVSDATVAVTALTTLVSVRINQGLASVRVDLGDNTEQLTAELVFSDNSTSTVTDSDDIDWRVGDTIEGTAATVDNTSGNKGEVSFTAVGTTEIKVFYDDGTDAIEDSINIIVE